MSHAFSSREERREYRGNVKNIAVVIREANDIRVHQPEKGGLITDRGSIHKRAEYDRHYTILFR